MTGRLERRDLQHDFAHDGLRVDQRKARHGVPGRAWNDFGFERVLAMSELSRWPSLQGAPTRP